MFFLFACFVRFFFGFGVFFIGFFEAQLGASCSLLMAKAHSKTTHGPPLQNTHAMGTKASTVVPQ